MQRRLVRALPAAAATTNLDPLFGCVRPSAQGLRRAVRASAEPRAKHGIQVLLLTFFHSAALRWAPFGHGSHGHEV
jgi:hypothetical protein